MLSILKTDVIPQSVILFVQKAQKISLFAKDFSVVLYRDFRESVRSEDTVRLYKHQCIYVQ